MQDAGGLPSNSSSVHTELEPRMVLAFVPAGVLFAITGEPAATWATGSFIVGVAAVMVGGVEVGS